MPKTKMFASLELRVDWSSDEARIFKINVDEMELTILQIL